MLKTDFFWADAVQADERLRNSYILFGNSCAYVERVANGRSTPYADLLIFPEGKLERHDLNHPGFNRFRIPLPMGWVNNSAYKRAYFVSRAPQRSRIHGMTRSNTSVLSIKKDGTLGLSDDFNFETIARDPQYKNAIIGEYPSLTMVLDKIRSGTCLAISKDMCIYRDNDGIRWLYVGIDRVGLFTGTDTLLLIAAFSYVKEQLSEAKEFTVANIVEF